MNRNALYIVAIVLLSLFITTGCKRIASLARPGGEEVTAAETVAPADPSPTIPAVTLTRETAPQPGSTATTLPTPKDGSNVIQMSDEEIIGLATVELAEPSPTIVTVTLTSEAAPQTSPTPTSVATTLVLEETVAMVCQEPPQAFNLFEALGIRRVSNLQFESEDLLTFGGWTDRSEPLVLPRTPEPTPESLTFPNSSFRILLVGGQLDLARGELGLRSLDVAAPLSNPCGETCPLEVLGQSPNGEWQLLQVNDWLREQMGLWLVSAETAIRLVPYVPAYPRWQWADDSSLLWLSYYFEDSGGETLVIPLDNPSVIHEFQFGGLLDPVMYWSDYSPLDNTAFVVPAPEMGHEDTEQVFTIDLENDPEKANGVWNIPGIASVAWNEATQSIVAQVVTDNGIKFQELPGGLSWTIPNETLTSLFPSFISAADDLPNGISAAGDWAISSSGESLVLLPQPAVIWVFHCVPAA